MTIHGHSGCVDKPLGGHLTHFHRDRSGITVEASIRALINTAALARELAAAPEMGNRLNGFRLVLVTADHRANATVRMKASIVGGNVDQTAPRMRRNGYIQIGLMPTLTIYHVRLTIHDLRLTIMRILNTLLLCLVHSSAAFSQTTSVFEFKATVDFAGQATDSIVAHKFIEGENKLILVGEKSVRVLDLANGNVVETHPIDIPRLGEDNSRVISPDGRRMLVFGNYSVDNKKNKIKRPAAVWDLQTGKQIAVLDKTKKPVRAAVWSKNGKTLATSSDQYAPRFVDSTSVETTFWDGETLQYRNALPADKVNWWYLTDDGSKCLFSTAPITNWFYIERFIGERGGPIHIWDTTAGILEKTISASDTNSLGNTREISISPDGRFLLYVAERPKAREADKRLVMREIDHNGSNAYQLKAKYELPPSPKLPSSGVSFSPDGRYFAFDAGKTLQIYETKTGEKKSELQKDDPPTHWLNDNKILLYAYGDNLEAAEAATGKQLYRQKVIYSYWDSSTTDGTPDMITVYDETIVVPHPEGRMFLTYSNQYVKVIDAQTGQLLQTLVEPPIDTSKRPDPKKGPRLSDKSLVWKADWSKDGRTLYVISHDRTLVSLWRVE